MTQIHDFQKGYYYQDCVSTLVTIKSLFGQNCDRFVADWKADDDSANSDDIVDDFKIISGNRHVCYQIKHSKTKGRRLRKIDLSDKSDAKGNKSQLNLAKIVRLCQKNPEIDFAFVFVVTWAYPKDGLQDFLIENENDISMISGGKKRIFDPNKFDNLQEFLNLKGIEKQAFANAISKLSLVIEAPKSTRDWYAPGDLEKELLAAAADIGIGKKPNQAITCETFCAQARDYLNQVRTGSGGNEFTAHDFVVKNAIIVNYGDIEASFGIDKNIFVSQKDQISEILNQISTHQTVALVGEPGSGKSYLTEELFETLGLSGFKVFHHYIFTHGAHGDKTQANPDIIVNGFLSDLQKQFPSIYNSKIKTFEKSVELIKHWDSLVPNTCIFVLDGLDHAYREYGDTEEISSLEKLIDELSKLSKIKLLIISQPLQFLSTISDCKIISMQKWGTAKIMLLANKCGKTMSVGDALQVEEKSEGNPLYIYYLIQSFPQGIENCPQFAGDINNYYRYLIKREDNIRGLALLAFLPFPFSVADFEEISNDGVRSQEFIDSVRPILRINENTLEYSLYHESFRRFVYGVSGEKRISPEKTYKDIIAFLESRDFYSDNKPFYHLCDLYCKTKQYSKCLEKCNFDYLVQSLYFGRDVPSVRNNIYCFGKAACESQDLFGLIRYCALERTVDIQFDSLFYGTSSRGFQELYLKLFGADRFRECFYGHIERNDEELNRITYSLATNRIGNISAYHVKKAHYSEYGEDIGLRLTALIKAASADHVIELKPELTLYEVSEIYEAFLAQGTSERIRPGKSRIARELINSYSLMNRYECEFDPDYSFIPDIENVYKTNYAEKVIEFSTYSEQHLEDKAFFHKLETKNNQNLYYILLRFIFDCKKATKQFACDQDQARYEDNLINNINNFSSRLRGPFFGTPRAADFSGYLFKSIFIRELLLPLTAFMDEEKCSAYFNTVIAINEKLMATLQNSHFSCIDLESILKQIPYILTESNRKAIVPILEEKIDKDLFLDIYQYGSEHLFSLGSMIFNWDREKAKALYRRGVELLLAYGDHKDIFMTDVLDIYKAAVASRTQIDERDELLLGNACLQLHNHTDHKDTDQYYGEWLEIVAERNPVLALRYAEDCQRTFLHYSNGDLYDAILNDNYLSLPADQLCKIVTKRLCSKTCSISPEIYIYVLSALKEKNSSDNIITLLFQIKDREDEIRLDSKQRSKLNEFFAEYLPDLCALSEANEKEYVTDLHKQIEIESHEIKSIVELASIEGLTDECFYKILINTKFDELAKDKLLDLYKKNLFSLHRLSTIVPKISVEDVGQDGYVFINATSFVFANNGWSRRFYYSNLLQNAYRLDKKMTLDYFFKSIKYVDGCYGFGGICLALAPYPEFKDEIRKIWKFIVEFTAKRTPFSIETIHPAKNVDVDICTIICSAVDVFSR